MHKNTKELQKIHKNLNYDYAYTSRRQKNHQKMYEVTKISKTPVCKKFSRYPHQNSGDKLLYFYMQLVECSIYFSFKQSA